MARQDAISNGEEYIGPLLKSPMADENIWAAGGENSISNFQCLHHRNQFLETFDIAISLVALIKNGLRNRSEEDYITSSLPLWI